MKFFIKPLAINHLPFAVDSHPPRPILGIYYQSGNEGWVLPSKAQASKPHDGPPAMTMALVVIATLIGAVLSARFNIFILVPAIAVGSAAALGIGMAQGNVLWPNLVAIVSVITALQLGYLGGALIRSTVASTRTPKVSPTLAAAHRLDHAIDLMSHRKNGP